MRPIPLVMVITAAFIFIAGAVAYKFYMQKEDVQARKIAADELKKAKDLEWEATRAEQELLTDPKKYFEVNEKEQALAKEEKREPSEIKNVIISVAKMFQAWNGTTLMEVPDDELIAGNFLRAEKDYLYTKYNQDRLLALLNSYISLDEIIKIHPRGNLIIYKRSNAGIIDGLEKQLADIRESFRSSYNALEKTREKFRKEELRLAKKRNEEILKLIKKEWERDDKKNLLDKLIAAKARKKSETKKQIAQGTKKYIDEETPYGGIVLHVDKESGMILVDKGSTKRVKDGWVFDVYGVIADKTFYKGKVEIVDVELNISTGKIVDTVRGEQFKAGDIIARKGYDPDKSITFAKAGSLSYSVQGLKNILSKHGHIYSETISDSVDYLIKGADVSSFTEEDHNKVNLAREHKIRIISEEEFLKLLGYTK